MSPENKNNNTKVPKSINHYFSAFYNFTKQLPHLYAYLLWPKVSFTFSYCSYLSKTTKTTILGISIHFIAFYEFIIHKKWNIKYYFKIEYHSLGNNYFIITFHVRKLVPENEIGNEMDAYLGVSVVRLRLKFFNVKLETTTKN